MANINAVLIEELLQFQLPAVNTVSFQGGQPLGFTPGSPRPRRHTKPRKNVGFEDDSRASVRYWEG
jgi:hypothetical protein